MRPRISISPPQSLHIICKELKDAETTLCTYFGDAKRLGPQLFELPVDGFGLDLVSGPENNELLPLVPPEKILQAGIVDARNTRLEEVDDLVRLIEGVRRVDGAAVTRFSPSCSLEFLPREKARAKLERLAEAVEKVRA